MLQGVTSCKIPHMRKLFVSSISVPECPKSITKRIHIDRRTLKPTKVYYKFYCEEGNRTIELLPSGFEKVTVVGCSGCRYKRASTER